MENEEGRKLLAIVQAAALEIAKEAPDNREARLDAYHAEWLKMAKDAGADDRLADEFAGQTRLFTKQLLMMLG